MEQYNLFKEGLLTLEPPVTESAKYRSISSRRMVHLGDANAPRKMAKTGRNMRNMKYVISNDVDDLLFRTPNSEEEIIDEVEEEEEEIPIIPEIIEEPSSLDELEDSDDDDDKEEDYVNVKNSHKRTRTR